MQGLEQAELPLHDIFAAPVLRVNTPKEKERCACLYRNPFHLLLQLTNVAHICRSNRLPVGVPSPFAACLLRKRALETRVVSAEQRHNQRQAVVAGPSPMAAVPLSLKDTILPRFDAWKRGDYAFDGQAYVWDSQKGEQLTRSPHWIIWKLSADLP